MWGVVLHMKISLLIIIKKTRFPPCRSPFTHLCPSFLPRYELSTTTSSMCPHCNSRTDSDNAWKQAGCLIYSTRACCKHDTKQVDSVGHQGMVDDKQSLVPHLTTSTQELALNNEGGGAYNLTLPHICRVLPCNWMSEVLHQCSSIL